MVFVLASGVSLPLNAQTIYKYQSADGSWHFSDKPPASKADGKTQQLELTSEKPTIDAPQVKMVSQDGHKNIVATNPWAGPVEMLVEIRTDQYDYLRHTLPADSTETLLEVPQNQTVDLDFYYVPGEPLDSIPKPQEYSPPFAPGKTYGISQGFNGQFSHNEQPNLYALDIAMPLGSDIHAARGGIVMAVKDQYVIGSASYAYFYDKANYVNILHDDGTTAIYAHILQGSVKVKVGDRVSRGQLLARSGNSGFSTGPHLHFAVRMNSNGHLKSVPFQVVDEKGGAFPLNSGDFLVGW
ncbi:hypothetical protein BTA51_04245 [Hahella sp. CCB-MM4]|nr:hypothetical protein BTA51_04245 [Hahella sp. CCB-MM4]